MVETRKMKIPCEIWSRVVGYFRPLHDWNPGKREEFLERKPYIIPENTKDGAA